VRGNPLRAKATGASSPQHRPAGGSAKRAINGRDVSDPRTGGGTQSACGSSATTSAQEPGRDHRPETASANPAFSTRSPPAQAEAAALELVARALAYFRPTGRALVAAVAGRKVIEYSRRCGHRSISRGPGQTHPSCLEQRFLFPPPTQAQSISKPSGASGAALSLPGC